MMKKRILKVIGLLGVCGILEITTPAVTFAETSTTDTSGMSDEEVYEKALDYAKKVYKYDKAAELLRTIECKLCLNGMPVPLLRNCYSIFNGTKYR